MLKHYLKIAIRQIGKNKVQYLLSIIGIAIGLLCFSMTSYYIRRFNNQFSAWPNSGRMANVYVKSTKNGYEHPYVPGKVVQELMGNPITGINKATYSYGYERANITICKENQEEIPFQCSFQNITEDFPAIFGVQTTKGQTPALKPGEVWISESSAKKILGKENPVGKTLYFSRADNDTSAIKYSTISAVIKDLPDGAREKSDLYFLETASIQPEREYRDLVVLLDKAVLSKEINQRLRRQIPAFGKNNDCYLTVRTFKEEMYKPDNLSATFFVPLIGSLILIAAMINFLKFCIQSFYNRTRELSLRKCLGSDSKGLFGLLFSEIAILFILSALASLALIEWVIPVYYQYMASKELINENMFIHTPTLICQEMEYLSFLLILCALIAAWAVFRIKYITLTEGVKGVKRQRHGVRNFMLGVQLFICFLFIGGAIGLGNIHLLTEDKRNNTLTDEECARIWKMELWEPQVQGHEEEIVSRIRTLAGVEDILLETPGKYLDYKNKLGEEVHGLQYLASKNYPNFMKLPVEGRMPQASNEIAVSRSLIWELEKDGEKNPTSVQLGDQTYQITGIYEQLPFEPVYTKEQTAKVNQYLRFSFITVPEKANYSTAYIKCVAGQEQNIRKEILRIVHSRLPASIPFLLTTKQEERFRLNGESELISNLFTLLSVISVIITVLGIYSAITLDTVSRQKEVAIRKINGAGPKVIALLFGKLYIRLLLISAVPSLAIVYTFLRILTKEKITIAPEWLNNPFMWLGIIFLTASIVFVTVAYRIWLISRLNPAETIKTE
ncbi:ABC transporter permease [uncultured Parabacteroides sp.]|uniref:ABC transporter permease n=1 Tax=uncultured Parabacteroides sp. TaxID=512312 RepID=UPI0026DC068D|nr:FtsX-like permease family protein [uncultured Parabacteroides sp.]